MQIQEQLQQAIRFHQAGDLAQAEAIYRAILAVQPRHAGALGLLGAIAQQLGHHGAAVELLRASTAIEPGDPRAFNNLGETLRAMGMIEESIEASRRALALDPDYAKAHSNLLLTLHYTAAAADRPGELLCEHQAWNQKHASRFTPAADSRRNVGDANRPLRIGYCSPDFKRHSVAYFIEPILAAHNRANVHVTCYSNTARADEVTARLRGLADEWRDIRGVDDDRAADMIRADGIDILVDLTGHMRRNRLLLMARKPAPVQATYLGYPNGTGLSAIDYRITDAVADPPGVTDAHCVERLVRLPRCAWCYRPLADSPDVVVRAAHGDGDQQITFGSFNKFPKIAPPVVSAWAQILRRVPRARLLLKAKSLCDPATQVRAIQLFEAAGIARDRVTVMGWAGDLRDHLALYNMIDIALDTFPYNGTTTTCEALWMGVPVVSVAGQTHVSRVGASLLTAIGLSELIALSPQAYVDIAVALALDPARRATLHAALRNRMKSSPLTDARAIVVHLEAAYRQMWRGDVR